jgi:serine/threonine protein kinase
MNILYNLEQNRVVRNQSSILCGLKAYATNQVHAVSVHPMAVGDLLDLLLHYGGVPHMARQLLMASTYGAMVSLHKQHIAHRDIKETNVLVMRDGTPVLVSNNSLACISYKTLIFSYTGKQP